MTEVMTERARLVPLDEARDPGQVGTKAATLGRLRSAGFPVPDGVVIPVSGAQADAASIAADVCRHLGDGPFAVRSSATAEDQTDASYAGQYETVLGVTGWKALGAAIERVWASVSFERVAEYRRRQGDDAPVPMAVIVQRLVDADAAGVAFTANPVTGSRDEVVINAVRGMGERLVSGEADPDQWLVGDGKARCEAAPEEALKRRQAEAVADLARQVEETLGGPQDIEWAIEGGGVSLLQARPITALPETAPTWEAPGDGYWFADLAHNPRPITPWTTSIYVPALANGINGVVADFGLVPDGFEFALVGHRLYGHVIPPGGREGRPPPRAVLWLLGRLLPPMRRKRKIAVAASRNDLTGTRAARWWQEWRAEAFARVRGLDEVDRASLTDAELDDHVAEVIEALHDGMELHFQLFPSHFVSVSELVRFCEDVLDWDESRACRLTSGHSPMSSAPGRRLAELTRMAAGRPEVRSALEGDDPAQALSIDSEFAAAFEAYQAEFGIRCLGYDAGQPTVGESPGLALDTIRGQLASGYDPAAVDAAIAAECKAAAAEAREALADRPDDLARFEDLLARAEAAFGVREDNEFPLVGATFGLARMAGLEVGRRLAERGAIGELDDVFMLEVGEARDVLRGGGNLRATVERRRQEIAESLASPPPRSFGEQHPPPDMSALPADLRRFNEAMVWFMEHDIDTPPLEREGDALTGVPASAGTYTGTVRVILDESQFDRLEPGDVLVCPITSPVWSVLFSKVGALVTDHGGLLSHSAIIARECGIPAVLATQTATSELNDGDVVVVDGVAGTVTKA